MIPKLKGIDYFNACQQGAEEAAKALGDVELLYDGPTEAKVDKAIEIIDNWITQKVDVIAVSADDPVAIAPVLRKARDAGIHVITWDADADPAKSGREFFVNQSTAETIGRTLVDVMAKEAGTEGKFAIVTASITADNQNTWMKWMRQQIKDRYPGMQIVAVKPSEENQQLAFQVTQDLLKTYPDLKGIWGISSVAFPGAADGVKQAGKSGKVAVTGLATPKSMKTFVESGTVKTVVLWNPVDLGYLTIYTAHALAKGDLTPGATSLQAGRLGTKEIKGDQVLLGPPMLFTKENIGKFDF